MINYKSKSTYVDKTTGEIISKKNAEQNFTILKTTKNYNNEGITEHNGYRYGTVIIEYTRECEPKRQLKIF